MLEDYTKNWYRYFFFTGARTEIGRNSFYRNGLLHLKMFRKFETSIIDIYFSYQLHGIFITLYIPVIYISVLSSYNGMKDGIRILATCHDSRKCGPPLTAKAVVRLQAVTCWICNRNWHWIRFISKLFTIPQSVEFHHCSNVILLSYNLRRYAFSTFESVIK